MNETFDPITLIMIAAAVIVFFKLRNVLGQKTGHQDPFDPFERRSNDSPPNDSPNEGKSQPPAHEDEKSDDNVIPMPGTTKASHRNEDKDEDEKPVWDGVAEKDSEMAAGLEQIQAQDHSFSAAQFLDGARAAYEMIVSGFAIGDKKSLKNLLSKEVYSGFATAIDDRKKQGMEMTTQFIGIDHADIVKAHMEKKKALLTVRFISELVSVVRDKSGEIVEGDATETQEITDIWTFERDLSSRDPNWRLVATDGDEA